MQLLGRVRMACYAGMHMIYATIRIRALLLCPSRWGVSRDTDSVPGRGAALGGRSAAGATSRVCGMGVPWVGGVLLVQPQVLMLCAKQGQNLTQSHSTTKILRLVSSKSLNNCALSK
eukprot:2980468-Rhodomonas_salina.2